MAASVDIRVSDILCFILNKFNKVTIKPLKRLILDFYSIVDISDAKTLLVNVLSTLKLDNAPSFTTKRRDSPDKGILE